MTLLGAEMISVAPGEVEIVLPLRPQWSQHHGYARAGASWAIADTTAGFAAQTQMAAQDGREKAVALALGAFMTLPGLADAD